MKIVATSNQASNSCTPAIPQPNFLLLLLASPPRFAPSISPLLYISLFFALSTLTSISVALYISPAMALLLCNIHLAAPYSSLPIFKTHHKRHRFRTTNNLKPRLSLPNPNSSAPPKRVLLPPLKSASSINGFPIQNAPEVSRDRRNAELFERVRRWIGSARTVLPGGSWWSFSDDVDVKLLAKPVTVLQALIRMWHLVAQDRWVIFTAFATLIVAAVCGFVLFFFGFCKSITYFY